MIFHKSHGKVTGWGGTTTTTIMVRWTEGGKSHEFQHCKCRHSGIGEKETQTQSVVGKIADFQGPDPKHGIPHFLNKMHMFLNIICAPRPRRLRNATREGGHYIFPIHVGPFQRGLDFREHLPKLTKTHAFSEPPLYGLK